tara:strand:- start:440 stop:646 length:207 start_codon:yes stop_codon:yes gene_type:complete
MESVVKEARKVHIKENEDKPQLLAVEYEDDKQEEFTITINVKINKRNIKSAQLGETFRCNQTSIRYGN